MMQLVTKSGNYDIRQCKKQNYTARQKLTVTTEGGRASAPTKRCSTTLLRIYNSLGMRLLHGQTQETRCGVNERA
jgi:hypothetical protein